LRAFVIYYIFLLQLSIANSSPFDYRKTSQRLLILNTLHTITTTSSKMASSGDLTMLKEMGFDEEKSAIALKKGGNCK